MDTNKVQILCEDAINRINNVHIACFSGHDKPLFLISETYPGIWLEHVYDSIFYAQMNPKYLQIAVNTVNLFIDRQTGEGQLPAYIWDSARVGVPPEQLVGYGQTQEVVSFAKLCLMLWKMNPETDFLERIYAACAKWENWLRTYRMTTDRGLVEMFVGYDTGHDNSERVSGIAHEGFHMENGKIMNAAVLPADDGVTPILPVDMNCNMFATETALSEMAAILGRSEESEMYAKRAVSIKEKLFEHCFDENDCFFYDVDRNGCKRKIKSSTIFHLFLEGVLDKDADKAVIDGIYTKYINNPSEFRTNYPFPAVSVTEPSRDRHKQPNSWGYYSQALIALRCTMWMDRYGFGKDFDNLCAKWIEGITRSYPEKRFCQELDPETGEMTECSEYYSSCMLFCLYAVRRLGIVKDIPEPRSMS